MSSNRQDLLWDLRQAISDYEDQVRRCEEMSEAWDSGDPCAMASNDPGLQYEADTKKDTLWGDVRKAAQAIANSH